MKGEFDVYIVAEAYPILGKLVFTRIVDVCLDYPSAKAIAGDSPAYVIRKHLVQKERGVGRG